MKPCEHCGLAKNQHTKRGRGSHAKLLCPDRDSVYDQSRESFDRECEARGRRNGPQIAPDWFLALNPGKGEFSYSYRVQTTRGPLDVNFYPTWVASRFAEHGRAADVLESPFNSKWNFHGDNCWESFRLCLQNLLPEAGVAGGQIGTRHFFDS